MNIRQLFRKLKAKLKGISNYKEVLDQSGNLQMYCGSNRLVTAEKDVKFSHVQKDDIVEISNTQSRDKEYGIVEIVFDQEFRVLNFPYSAFNKNGEPASKDCTGYITKLISNVSKGKIK